MVALASPQRPLVEKLARRRRRRRATRRGDRHRRSRERARLACIPGAAIDDRARARRAATADLLCAALRLLGDPAAIPLVGNLGGAWLLVEATTAASALLVGFGGKPRALEAAWKYLILTSLGLGVALLGIVMLAAGSAHGGLDALSWRELGHVRSETRARRVPVARSPGSRRRSAGRRCTTGCPTHTPRRPHPSPRCSRRRCCPRCCSSPGARASRSPP